MLKIPGRDVLRIGDPDDGAHPDGAARVRDYAADFAERLAESRQRQRESQRKDLNGSHTHKNGPPAV